MTKEQEIYRNMKRRGRIYKAYGKWGIKYEGLYKAIEEAGYTDYKTIWKIIHRMEDKGYIRGSKDVCGRNYELNSRYIILKWVN